MTDTSRKLAQEMLAAIRKEKQAALDLVRELEEREKLAERLASDAHSLPIPPRPRIKLRRELDEVLRELISEGRLGTNQEIAELAKDRGATFKDVRSINGSMLGYMRAAMVGREGDKWVTAKK